MYSVPSHVRGSDGDMDFLVDLPQGYDLFGRMPRMSSRTCSGGRLISFEH